jgi:hypothetical protein
MSAVSDLEMFLLLHRDHGRLTPVLGQRTHTAIAWKLPVCAASMGRWVTTEDACLDMALGYAQAGH